MVEFNVQISHSSIGKMGQFSIDALNRGIIILRDTSLCTHHRHKKERVAQSRKIIQLKCNQKINRFFLCTQFSDLILIGYGHEMFANNRALSRDLKETSTHLSWLQGIEH